MVDVGVALAWVTISAVSLKGLSAFGRVSAYGRGQTDLARCEGELALDEIYPVLGLPTASSGDPL